MDNAAKVTVAQVSEGAQDLLTSGLWALLLAGLVTASYFLVVHRPTSWFRWEAINASGWVVIVWIFYVRAVVLLLIRGSANWQGWADSAVSLGLLVLVDLLLLARVLSFISYRRQYRVEHPNATARAHND